MTRRLSAAASAAAALAVAWLSAGNAPPQDARQTFRSGTDVVVVDVSVRKGNTPVTGLTAADFELRDNGVRQEIETVETAAVPIDLSIVVDVSGNPDRPWAKPPPRARVAAEVEAEVRRLTRLLREGDRVRLFAVDTYVQQIWPLQPASTLPPVRAVSYDGQATLYNTLATILLQPVEPTRRHVVVAATRGLDTQSSITAAGVRAIAERADAQLHLVMQETDADAEVSVRDFQCGSMDLCRPTARFWLPARRRLFNAIPVSNKDGAPRILMPDGVELKAGAEASGGGLYQGELIAGATLHGTFTKAFDDFRQSYVLRYTARGVARAGWHQISVTVPGDRSLKIRARTGYAIDEPAPAPVPAKSDAVLRSLEDLVSAYGRGEYDRVRQNLSQHADPARLVADFDRGGNPWPASPRLEAIFALEVAETGVFSPRPAAREAGVRLLERFENLIKHPIDPDAFERAWLAAELAMLQGTIRPAVTRAFVDRALARFPDDARFHLARAIVTDQPFPLSGPTGDARSVPAAEAVEAHTADVIARYESAAAFPEVRAEALMRLGMFLHRNGRADEALARLTEAAGAASVDPHVRYLRELLLGRVLMSLGRGSEALSAFRRALAIVPGAQSARVALMNGLIATGDRAAAEALAEVVQSSPTGVFDPWWMYWQGLYRQYPSAIRTAQAMVGR